MPDDAVAGEGGNGRNHSAAAWDAAEATWEAADAAQQAARARRVLGRIAPFSKAARLHRIAEAASKTASRGRQAAEAQDLREVGFSAAQAAEHSAQAAELLVGWEGMGAVRDAARRAARAANRVAAAAPTDDTDRALAELAEATRAAAASTVRAIGAARTASRRRWHQISAGRLDVVVGSLIAIIFTGTLIALVFGDATSKEAATAGQTLALAGIGFFFGAALRRRSVPRGPAPPVLEPIPPPSEAPDPQPRFRNPREQG